MVDTILTVAAEAVTVFGLVWVAVGLVVQYPQWRRNGRSFEPPIPDVDLPPLGELLAEAEALVLRAAQWGQVAAVTIATPVAIARVPQAATSAWAAQPCTALRKACRDAGIRWRNAHGQGKHLSKGEMVAALSA